MIRTVAESTGASGVALEPWPESGLSTFPLLFAVKCRAGTVWGQIHVISYLCRNFGAFCGTDRIVLVRPAFRAQHSSLSAGMLESTGAALRVTSGAVTALNE